ncbi:MAG: hypothetical protein WEF86_00715 [Gemmatimonadota bacterium]
MDHDGFMIGMLLGGALVAAVPTILVVGIGIYVLRLQRARQRHDAATRAKEVSP